MDLIPVAGPWITSKEIESVADAAANAWYGNAGVYNQRFEAAFAAYVARRHAISLPSCTSALHLALATAVWIAVSALIVLTFSRPGTRWSGVSHG